MGLLINGNSIKDEGILKDLHRFLQIYQSTFEECSTELKTSSVQTVTATTRSVYVNQREFAVVLKEDERNICKIGTDMATTCHIVVLRCPATSVTALGHFDGISTRQGVHDMTNAFLTEVLFIFSKSEDVKDFDIELHIIGGFEDERNISEALSVEILTEFNSYKPELVTGVPDVRIHLKTFCATTLNTITEIKKDSKKTNAVSREIKSPAILGVIIDSRSGQISNAVFSEDAKGPCSDLRSARSANGVKTMANIYRPRQGLIVIEPFTYTPMPDVELWLAQSDNFIRRYMSTSPDVEPDNFEDNMRQTLRFILNHPDPMRSIFVDGNPITYEPTFSDGRMSWKKL